MVKKQEQEKININVEVDKDLHTKLRMKALEKGIEFHYYIRLLFQEAVK